MSLSWIPVAPSWSKQAHLRLALHEGGHNLGIFGNATMLEYGDQALGPLSQPSFRADIFNDPFTVMGTETYLGHYNAEEKVQLGWLTEMVDVTRPGIYDLVPLSSPATGVKALRVPRIAGRNGWLWIEQRRPSGLYESTLPQSAAGALAHYEQPDWQPLRFSTKLIDFTPNSLPGDQDFEDAPLAAGRVWNDLWTPLSLAVSAAANDVLRVKVSNDSCVTLSAATRSHGAGAETGIVQVSAPNDCTWPVLSSDPWLTVTSAGSGTGNGTVMYRLTPNTGTMPRTATLAIGRQPFEIEQTSTNQAPALAKLYPDTGSGPAGIFDLYLTDPNGNDDLKILRINFNTAPEAAGGCLVEYDRSTGTVRLADDAGSGWVGPVPAAQAASLQNSRCAVRAAFNNFSELFVAIAFTGRDRQELNVYASGQDKSGLESGWIEAGKWLVRPNRPPASVSVLPESGNGTAQAFTFVASDPDGAYDMLSLVVTIGDTNSRCTLEIRPPRDELAVEGQVARFRLDTTLETAACSIGVRASRILRAGAELWAQIPITFRPGFEGPKEIRLTATDISGATFTRIAGTWTPGSQPGPAPQISAAGVVNAASFAGGPVAPGEIVTIFGTNLGPEPMAYAAYDSAGVLGNEAGETRVFFNDIQAPIVHASSGQVSAIVPLEVLWHSAPTTSMRVVHQGRSSNAVTLGVALSAPGIFRTGGGTLAVVVNQDNSLNSVSNPAPRGSIITFFATGEGAGPYGIAARMPEPGNWPKATGVVAAFAGVPGLIDFEGLVYPGVYQVNVRVPENAPAGSNVPLTMSVGGASSPNGATIALK